jgi:hypothetical protein
MTSDDFFRDLPVIDDVSRIMRPANFKSLPPDWHLVVTDIKNSTPAIEMGLYKHVNIVGAARIISVLNVTSPLQIPFVFGGDGAILAVPDSYLKRTHEALLGTRLMALKRFKLDLRIGSVPVSALIEAGRPVLVARYRVSPNNIQALFAGGGADHAETMVKKNAPGAYVPSFEKGESLPKADFSGLECRWQDVPSPRGETVCLIVKSLLPGEEESAVLYEEILQKLNDIYGDDTNSHPLSLENLVLSLATDSLMPETQVRRQDDTKVGLLKYLFRLKLLVLAGKIMMRFGIKTSATDWSVYKKTLIQNTDFRRFIESYRQVLSGTADQRKELEDYLASRFAKGELVYGVHVSDRALMTCLVFDYSGNHLHFLDGADGGFALAAKEMKARVKGAAVPKEAPLNE